MRIYSICDYCQEIFGSSEVEGPDGVVELKGVCESCQGELNSYEHAAPLNHHYYH